MRVMRNLAIAAGIAALAPAVNAAPIVTFWNYQVETHFTTATFIPIPGQGAVGNGPTTSCGAGGAPIPTTGGQTPATPCTAALADTLAWGNTSPQSSLVITGNPAINKANPANPGPGQLKTDVNAIPNPTYAAGTVGLTQTFTHNNFVIPLDSWTLSKADVLGFLTLDPTAYDPAMPDTNGPFGPVTLPITVRFVETPNNGVTCANTPPGPGVGGPPAANPCPDIFVIEGGINNFTFWYDALTGVPSIVDPLDPNAVKYFVQIFPTSGTNDPTVLQTLSDSECAQAGAASGCQGFITPENASTAVQFGFSITTQPIVLVPEPGTLALFALGLIGLGYTVRRRQA